MTATQEVLDLFADDLDRDCVTIRCFEGMHGEGCDDDGNCHDRVPGVCIVKDWLDAAGPDAVGLEFPPGLTEVTAPFLATVGWEFDHPVLQVIDPAGSTSYLPGDAP